MRPVSLSSLKRYVQNRLLAPPKYLSRNFIQPDESQMQVLEDIIADLLNIDLSNMNASQKANLESHYAKRLHVARTVIVPWVSSIVNIKNKKILEIGSGTGSSTIAMAEQGALVTGIDINAKALSVATQRADIYGLDVEYVCANANSLTEKYNVGDCDAIIYFACLEHMTISERLSSLKDAWDLLPVGGYLIIVDTPNRLWNYDQHSFLLPFFHWLPDELALQYTKYSTRNITFEDSYENNMEKFLRCGRGVSFHEFDLAIKPVHELKVLSYLHKYKGRIHNMAWPKAHHKFKAMLMDLCPAVHEGFFIDSLDLIILKT